MTRQIAAIFLLTIGVTPLNAVAESQPTRIEPGMIAPGFTVEQLNDVPFTLNETPTVIWFMASFCSYMGQVYSEMGENCDAAADRLRRAYSLYGDQFRWIGIGFEPEVLRNNVVAYRTKHEIPFALAIDDERRVWRDYGVRFAPTVIIVNDGKVAYRAQETLEGMEAAFEALANIN